MKNIGTQKIETDRLILRPFCINDAKPMFNNWAANPNVTKYLIWEPHESLEVSKQIINTWLENNKDLSSYQWAIELKEINEPIGSIGSVKLDEKTESVSIGYCIGEKWWGQGITPEALKAVIAFFFDEVDAKCVNSYHDPRNPNSGKVMKKIGMSYEGMRRCSDINNQGICDSAWYSILVDEYKENKRKHDIWDELYCKAKSMQNARKVSNYVEAGGVSAAILSKTGKIYTGVCVDTCSTLGICAERNAIFNMLTNGEQDIIKVIALMPDGSTGAPCGACRELMVQLMPDSYQNIEVMLDYEKRKTITLGELTPEWWI